ncbi:pyridoxamine 5'-phosphate oxidase family protein [Marinobacteraceae bacterium S3BR75-40.1]
MVDEAKEEQRSQAAETVSWLLTNCASLCLATLDDDGLPEASTAPFLYQDGRFYILVSELSPHTRNLFYHPQVSVLILEPETSAHNPFARRRLSLRCLAEKVTAEDDALSERLDAFQARHGDTVAVLRELPDFHLIELQVVSGRLIKGFGQAWHLDEWLTPQQHIQPN